MNAPATNGQRFTREEFKHKTNERHEKSQEKKVIRVCSFASFVCFAVETLKVVLVTSISRAKNDQSSQRQHTFLTFSKQKVMIHKVVRAPFRANQMWLEPIGRVSEVFHGSN
jgi:trehalose/maltose hydrolase-like predicted phosphorylase